MKLEEFKVSTKGEYSIYEVAPQQSIEEKKQVAQAFVDRFASNAELFRKTHKFSVTNGSFGSVGNQYTQVCLIALINEAQGYEIIENIENPSILFRFHETTQ